MTQAQFDMAMSEIVVGNEDFIWPDEVVSGGCSRGADHFGEVWAKAWKIPVTVMEADWASYGPSAGPKRNRQMAQYGDVLLAIWDGKSRGTSNMIDEMKKLGKRVWVSNTNDPPSA